MPLLADRFLAALLAADGGEADALVGEALDAGIAPTRVQVGVVQAAMAEIGALWARGEIDVAQEHVATAIAHRVLVRLYDALHAAVPGSRERVVLAAVEGQHHTLGLRMVADVLEGAGFDVLYLGGNVPVKALGDFVARHRPALVGLTFRSCAGADHSHEALQALTRACPEARIIVGGDQPPQPLLRAGAVWIRSSDDLLPAVAALLPGDEARAPFPQHAHVAASPAAAPIAADQSVVARLVGEAAGAADSGRHYVRQAHAFRRLALCDPLTGLANRRAFDDVAHTLAAPDRPASLLVIDVDRFKTINDTAGHDAGDRLLRSVATAIAAAVRPSDFCARIGGDEFAIVLTDCSGDDALVVAERVRRDVARLDAGVTLSIGVAPLGGDDVRGAMLAADQALYAAKAAGRDGVLAAV